MNAELKKEREMKKGMWHGKNKKNIVYPKDLFGTPLLTTFYVIEY